MLQDAKNTALDACCKAVTEETKIMQANPLLNLILLV